MRLAEELQLEQNVSRVQIPLMSNIFVPYTQLRHNSAESKQRFFSPIERSVAYSRYLSVRADILTLYKKYT